MIVVVYAALYTCFRLIETVEFVQVQELEFKRGKKAFHTRIVIAISYAGCAWLYLTLVQHAGVDRHPVLTSLVGMQIGFSRGRTLSNVCRRIAPTISNRGASRS